MRLDRDSNFRFGVYEIDFGAGEVRKAGVPVPVEPQVFDLIALLASRPGELVSRDEVIEAVWHGRIVSESAIATRINAARAALGDDGKAQKMIQTVPRRGFRFVGGALDSTPDLTLPDKPSIAVLPFENMSGNPEQEFFSDGIADDIITELARYDELFVIARNSSFAFKGRSVDVRKIARELGVQFVLEGSVRRAGGRVRVTAQLIDTASGNHVWADRYDRELEDIFAVQDEITAVIVNTLVGKVMRSHFDRALLKAPENMDAYDHALRAMVHFRDGLPTTIASRVWKPRKPSRSILSSRAPRRCWVGAMAPTSSCIGETIGSCPARRRFNPESAPSRWTTWSPGRMPRWDLRMSIAQEILTTASRRSSAPWSSIRTTRISMAGWPLCNASMENLKRPSRKSRRQRASTL